MIAAVGARNLSKVDAGVVQTLMQARYQNSNRGQFISEDPVSLGDPKQQVLSDPQSLNSYGYANDNPITKSDPLGTFAIGVNYGATAEGGFGAFSANNANTGVSLVFDPKTFQASIVYTASGAVNSGYLKNYQSAPDNGQAPFVIGLYGGAGRQYSFSPNATKPDDLQGVQDTINVNVGPASASVQGADTDNPTYSIGAGTKGFASASRYPAYTKVVSTISINQSLDRAKTQLASYYTSAVATVQTQVNAIQTKLNQSSQNSTSKAQ